MSANKNKICYVFGAGELRECSIQPANEDLIIAADGGYDYTLEFGIPVDVVIGDFDSIQTSMLPDNRIVHPTKKDDTDMILALKYGLNLGYKEFHIYGGLGGRLDHTLANIQALSFLNKQKAKGFLFGDSYTITTITNDTLILPAKETGYLSIFSLSDESNNVSIKNLKYEMKQGTLTRSFPIGVSNEFIGQVSSISVEDGSLCILWYNQ